MAKLGYATRRKGRAELIIAARCNGRALRRMAGHSNGPAWLGGATAQRSIAKPFVAMALHRKEK